MNKHAVRKLSLALLLLLPIASVERAFASGTGPTSPTSPTATAPAPPAPSGVTGTDPEPIEPDIVGLILTLLHLA